MPMYDLKCTKCGHEEYNVLNSIKNEFPKCEKCGEKMQVNYENADYGIVKRGDGWTPGAGSNGRKA